MQRASPSSATSDFYTQQGEDTQQSDLSEQSYSSNASSTHKQSRASSKQKKSTKKKKTNREILALQKKHGYDQKSLTTKVSQRIVVLERPTDENPAYHYKSDPEIRLQVNKGANNSLNINSTVVPYNKVDDAQKHFSQRIDRLPRTTSEQNEVYTLILLLYSYTLTRSQFDNPVGKTSLANLDCVDSDSYSKDPNALYSKAETVALSEPMHNIFTKARSDNEKRNIIEVSNTRVRKITPQQISQYREEKDYQTFSAIP